MRINGDDGELIKSQNINPKKNSIANKINANPNLASFLKKYLFKEKPIKIIVIIAEIKFAISNLYIIMPYNLAATIREIKKTSTINAKLYK